MIVSAYNPETDKLEKTYLQTQHNAGLSALLVKNNDRFAVNQKALIGEIGHERSEIVTVGGLTDRTGISLTDPTEFHHDADDPVYVLEYDQVDFYRSDSENGTYTMIASVDIDVDNEDRLTKYDDLTGATTSWYKVKYVNSVTEKETEFSDPMQATGYPSNSVGRVIDAVVRRVRDSAYTVLTVDEYIDICNEVNDDLLTQSHRPFRFLKTSVKLNTVAGQNYVELPDDLWKFDRVEFTHSIGGRTMSYPITPITMEQWDSRYNNSTWTPSDELIDIALDEVDHRLYLGPTPRTAGTEVIELFYWRKFPELTGVADTVITPNTLIYRYKMMAEYYTAKSESDNQFARLAQTYENKYGAEVVKMQRVNRLDAGTTREIKPLKGYRKRYVL